MVKDFNDGRVRMEPFVRVQKTMLGHGLDGKTWSTTDNDYNYGHTLPSIILAATGTISRELAAEQALEMRNARRFVSKSSIWKISGNEQFTIEPQCIVPTDFSLPKIMIHYVLGRGKIALNICDCCEQLPKKFGLV